MKQHKSALLFDQKPIAKNCAFEINAFKGCIKKSITALEWKILGKC